MKILSKLTLAATLALSIIHCPLVIGQVTPTTVFVLTNLPAYIAPNSTSNLFAAGAIPTNNVISLRQGQGMAAAMSYNGTNSAATGGFSANWAVSLDGTNWSTTGFLQVTNTANGTSVCNIVTNFASAILNNELYIAPYSIQNATTSASGGVSLSGVTVSFGNIVPGGYP
ncbi:MAG: hypothetical protein ABSA83_07185 [Verrucomicrobiota bacterium]|jgi:hypothetical protein